MTEFSLIEQAALQHAAAFATDPRGQLEFANDRYCAMRGEAAKYLNGYTLPWVARLAAHADTPDNAAPLWHGELPPECGSGLLGTMVARRDAAGELCGFLCFVSPQPARSLSPAARPAPELVGIFLASPAGDPLFISDQLHARYAQLPPELCELDAAVCSLEQWQQVADTGWRRWLRGQTPDFVAEIELTTRNGDTERLQQRATRLVAGGQCLGIVGTLCVVDPAACRVQQPQAAEVEPSLEVLLDRLLGHAARFTRDLLEGGRLHDLGEVERFLQGFTTVALSSRFGACADDTGARDRATLHAAREQLAYP